jgi:hypothetical protein
MKIITTVRAAKENIFRKSSHFGELDPIFSTSRLDAMRANIMPTARLQ